MGEYYVKFDVPRGAINGYDFYQNTSRVKGAAVTALCMTKGKLDYADQEFAMTGPTETKTAKTIEGTISDWYKRSSTVAVGHYKTAERYARLNGMLSGSSAILSAAVGTAVFVTLQQQPKPWIKIMVGLVSVVVAVLATLSATLGFQEKAERHRLAGSRYNAVGRELEQLMSQPTLETTSLTNVRLRLDALAQEVPHIPRSVHDELSDAVSIDKWSRPPLLTGIRRPFRAEK